jgi:N-acyl homoserine lactone hydrolase
MPDQNELRLYILDCGHLIGTGVPFISATGEREERTATFAVGCYLVRHPAGLLLWDTGLSDALAEKPGGVDAGPWHLTVTKTKAAHLAALGVAPDDITHLAFSHLHADHTGDAGTFTSATVLVHEREHAVAFAPVPPAGYNAPSYAALKERPTIQIRGDYDVFGDGLVRILEAPGHSAGHQVLALALPETGPVLLSGDLYYSARDRAE